MLVNMAFLMTEILVILQFMNPIGDLFPSYIQMVVFALWLLFVCFDKKLIWKFISISLVSAVILCFTFIRCIEAGTLDMGYFSPMQAVIGRYQFFVYPTMFIYIIRLEAKKKRRIFNLAVISIITTVIVSLYYVIGVYPQAIRNTQGVSFFGVGDFQLMYAMALFSGPYLSYIRKRWANKDRALVHIISFGLICLCIILCNLVTAVVTLALSIALSYYFYTKKLRHKLFLITIAGGAVAFKKVWADLLRNIAEKNIFYWSTNKKIIAVANLISGEHYGLDTISVRIKLTKTSWNSFKEHFLFGIDFRNHQSGVIGGHAQWVDDLARFGIFGNIIIWGNYIYIARYTIKNSCSFEMRSSLIVAWITFFVLGFLNPCLSGTIFMIMFIVIPCMYETSSGESDCEGAGIKPI